MTDNLFQKLEEKTMILLTKVEDMQNEIQEAHQENSILKAKIVALETEKENNIKKLQDLLSLFEPDVAPQTMVANVAKPVLVQG